MSTNRSPNNSASVVAEVGQKIYAYVKSVCIFVFLHFYFYLICLLKVDAERGRIGLTINTPINIERRLQQTIGIFPLSPFPFPIFHTLPLPPPLLLFFLKSLTFQDISQLKEGTVRVGRVTRRENYGIFVNIGVCILIL
jgi:hypothetical protein